MDKVFTLEDMQEEYIKGQNNMANNLDSLIKQRKWVWNEEKFGGVRHHQMFDSFVEELLSETKKLKLKLEKEVRE